MKPLHQPISLVAERAVRYLRDREGPEASVSLARWLLATIVPDERSATRVLESAFAGDARLSYGRGGWRLVHTVEAEAPQRVEPDRVMIFVRGRRPARGHSFVLHSVSVLRLSGDDVVTACGGDVAEGAPAQLRRALSAALEAAVPVIHDPPGARRAFERWLGERLVAPISLRRLAQERLGLPAHHELHDLAARLGVTWREVDDPLEQADLLDTCLARLRRPDEELTALREPDGNRSRPIDWSRFAFDPGFLRRIPRSAGTYRFLDRDGSLLYVGKAKDLRRRIGSYFREGAVRSARVQKLLDRLHRIDVEPSGSDLEAMLREAEQIRLESPDANVQRHVHAREGREARLASILILEQAELPAVLRAYLIHHGRLIARIAIGPRGGGLTQIERVLDAYFFFMPDGPTPLPGPDVDIEVVARWLAANRDRVVAFDPTDLRSAREVTDRLRWFLEQGSPFESDGSPIFPR